ncbi:hypothetical protein HK101_003249 [Irineochytrium annulatum]|nr:hypothetical protein HK101_003249 [Irineochytrium annulatum]
MRRQRSHSLETGTSPVSTEIDVPPLKDFYPHHFINHQHIHQPQQQHTQIGTFGPQLRSSFSSTNRPQVPYNNWNVVPTVGSKVLMGAGQPPNATGGGNNQGVTQMMRQRTREDPTRRPQPQLTPATYRSWQPPQPTSNFYPYYQTLPPHPHQHQPNGANVNGMSGMTSQHQNQHQQHQLPAPPSAPQHNQPQQSYHIHQQTQQQHRPHQVMHYTVPPQQPPSANPVAVPPAGPSQGICAGGQKQSQLSAALASAGKLGPQQHQQQQHHAPIFGTWGENGGVGRVGVGVGTAAGRIKGRQSRLSVDAIPFVPDYYRNGDAAASTVLASVTRKSSTGDIGLALKGRGEESQLSRMMSSLDLASPVLSAPWPIRKSMERRSEPEPINADDTASLSSSMTSDSSVEILISGGATCLPFFITGETPATYSNKKTAPRSHSESPISRASRSRDVDPPRPSDEQQFRPKARSHSAVSVPMETSNFGAPVRGRAFEVLTDRRETADGRSQGEDFISFTASKAITIQPSTERRSPKRPPIVQAKKTRKSLPLTKSTVKISPKDPSSPVAIGKLTEGFTPARHGGSGDEPRKGIASIENSLFSPTNAETPHWHQRFGWSWGCVDASLKSDTGKEDFTYECGEVNTDAAEGGGLGITQQLARSTEACQIAIGWTAVQWCDLAIEAPSVDSNILVANCHGKCAATSTCSPSCGEWPSAIDDTASGFDVSFQCIGFKNATPCLNCVRFNKTDICIGPHDEEAAA